MSVPPAHLASPVRRPQHCEEIGLGYSCSVWDVTSAKEIVSLNPILIKVGSPSNQHWEMQKVLRDEYGGDIHISTGMTTKEEVEKIVTFWEEGAGDAKNRRPCYTNTLTHSHSHRPHTRTGPCASNAVGLLSSRRAVARASLALAPPPRVCGENSLPFRCP